MYTNRGRGFEYYILILERKLIFMAGSSTLNKILEELKRTGAPNDLLKEAEKIKKEHEARVSALEETYKNYSDQCHGLVDTWKQQLDLRKQAKDNKELCEINKQIKETESAIKVIKEKLKKLKKDIANTLNPCRKTLEDLGRVFGERFQYASVETAKRHYDPGRYARSCDIIKRIDNLLKWMTNEELDLDEGC